MVEHLRKQVFCHIDDDLIISARYNLFTNLLDIRDNHMEWDTVVEFIVDEEPLDTIWRIVGKLSCYGIVLSPLIDNKLAEIALEYMNDVILSLGDDDINPKCLVHHNKRELLNLVLDDPVYGKISFSDRYSIYTSIDDCDTYLPEYMVAHVLKLRNWERSAAMKRVIHEYKTNGLNLTVGDIIRRCFSIVEGNGGIHINTITSNRCRVDIIYYLNNMS